MNYSHPNLTSSQNPTRKLQGLSLRAKVILTAIALGVIPVAVIGIVSYKVTQNYDTQQINQTQRSRAERMAQMLEQYLVSRKQEAETLTTSPIFTNPNTIRAVTTGQKKAALDSFQTKTGFYDSIVYLDLQGNPLFQSQSELPLRKNYSSRQYFQTAIAQKQTTLNRLQVSSYTGKPKIELAIPVKNAWTDEVIGVMRFRIPSQKIVPLFEDYINSGEQWYLINTKGILFASAIENLNNKPFNNYFPQIQSAHSVKESISTVVNNPLDGDGEQMINYVPVKIGTINPDLNLGTAIALDTDIAFASLKSLKWIFLGGTISTALLLGATAGFLANRIIKPLIKLTAVVGEISQGKLNTRIKLNRQDELAILGDGINEMASQLEGSIQRQKTIARTSELLTRISQSRTSRELQLPFSLFLAEVRKFIKSDRIIFYEFDSQWCGTVLGESVSPNFSHILGVEFKDSCFTKEYVRKYQAGRIKAISDIYRANLTPCHLEQLEPYEVKASLIVPVILEPSIFSKSEQLVGLLIAHQCSETRVWAQSDVDYLQQIAYQLATVLRGYIVDREENAQKVDFQNDLDRIQNQMQDLALGKISENLDHPTNSSRAFTRSFDRFAKNLHRILGDIQTPSRQINRELIDNKKYLAEMQDRLKQQTNQLALIFAFIEQIGNSIIEVSSQVGVASDTVDSVVKDLESEKVNFGHAISFMSQLEENLKKNRNKVKNLNLASQKMIKVITSIRKINLRASILANKLSKRIPKLDESAFSLKEEIKSIQQSIAATKELEVVVSNIEREIAEVLQEYQKSENKLEQENYLIANSSKNLEQIVKVTKTAQQNLFSLVNMTKIQQKTAQQIDDFKEELNETSLSINLLSDRTLESLEETSLTAKDLENAIDFFKLPPTNN